MADILYIKGTTTTLTKAAGDVVANKSEYSELVKIPDWRVILSDAGVTPFYWNKQWESAQDAIQENPDAVEEILRAKFQDEKSRRTLALTGNAQLWAMRGKKVRLTTLEMIREAQRNAAVQPEMDTSAKAKAKTPKTKKTATQEPSVNVFAENTIAIPDTVLPGEVPEIDATENESSLKFCPVCDNYLYMQVDVESKGLTRMCRKCGHREEDTKGGLVMEMMIQQQSSEGYKILLNEFTRKDPRLPHIRKNISCPNVTCDSNKGGKDPDVIYIKYDLVNLMYLYICDICGEKWHSRDRS